MSEITSSSKIHEIDLSTSLILPSSSMFRDQKCICLGVHTNDEAVYKTIVILLTRRRPSVQVNTKSCSTFCTSLLSQFIPFCVTKQKQKENVFMCSIYMICIHTHIQTHIQTYIYMLYIFHIWVYIYSIYIYVYIFLFIKIKFDLRRESLVESLASLPSPS